MPGPHKVWIPFFASGADSVSAGATIYDHTFYMGSLRDNLRYPFLVDQPFTVLETRGYAAMTPFLSAGSIQGTYVAYGSEISFVVSPELYADSDVIPVPAVQPLDVFATVHFCDIQRTVARSTDPPFVSRGMRKVSPDEDILIWCTYRVDSNRPLRSGSFLAVVMGRVLIQY